MAAAGGGSSGLKPKREHTGKKRMELHEYSVATLGAGNMQEAVKLPRGEDFQEWLAVHVVDFFNEISLLYGIIAEYCTPESCPIMSAGPKFEYLWMDGVRYKKPVKVSASQYINLLMSWVEKQISDPALFPVEDGVEFPKKFRSTCKQMLKRMFRVYGHIYHHHIHKMVALDCEAHLNTCFKHFVYFCKEFKLVDDREMLPLADTIKHMMAKDQEKSKKYRPKYSYATGAAATTATGATGGVPPS